jgi:hypothetical protein
VHRITKDQALADAALLQARLDLPGDIHDLPTLRELEPEFFAKGFHVSLLASDQLIDNLIQVSPDVGWLQPHFQWSISFSENQSRLPPRSNGAERIPYVTAFSSQRPQSW